MRFQNPPNPIHVHKIPVQAKHQNLLLYIQLKIKIHVIQKACNLL